MPGTVADAPSVPASFANNFWGKDDAGVGPLLERMHSAKTTCDELKSFYNTRAAIEDEYARKLLALCRKPLGSQESGTLRASLDVTRGEVEAMAKAHQGIAGQMKSELEEPLSAFAGGMKERRKIVQTGIEKLLKVKQTQTHNVNKSRDKFEQDCLRIKGYLAQGHMVMGQEERKNKAKLEKTQIQMASASNEYEAAIKSLEETTGRWNKEWKAACDKFQDLEEERLDFTKSSLWELANIASTVCVTDDASCEKIRVSLESCEVEKDIVGFIRNRGTGQEIPDPPRYINFCRGDAPDSASETSEDDAYSVAQFQRTINPAFRTSSPAPSALESHHAPRSDMSANVSIHEDNMPTPRSHEGGANSVIARNADNALNMATPRSRETTVTPQKTATREPPPVQPDFGRRQIAQAQAARQQGQQLELAPVPYNEQPPDGMTMFCRTDGPSGGGAQSEHSSMHSPVRPGSRDSQSEYSNPTSFSSVEPTSGKASPTKPPALVNGPLSSHPPSPLKPSPDKKRSSFFSNSPFRRKSKRELHEPDSNGSAPPSGGYNTGTANSTNGSRAGTWGPQRSSANRPGISTRDFAARGADDLEPVDPRANFQLNVGNNVFDVASPDARRSHDGGRPGTSGGGGTGPPSKMPGLRGSTQARKSLDDEDPIAAALAELKGVSKQSSTRVSADRYHGIQTPAPGPGMQSQAAAQAGKRGTPPPSYDSSGPPSNGPGSAMRRLDAPQPAHTAAQMQAATRKYAHQNADMYGSSNPRGQAGDGYGGQRPGTRNGGPPSHGGPGSYNGPRSTSPLPMRATSPRPNGHPDAYRATSPNPYGTSTRSAGPSPTKGPGGSSMPYQRGPSPQPGFNGRPGTAGGAYGGAGGPSMGRPHDGGAFGNPRGPGGPHGRPMSYYGGPMQGSHGPANGGRPDRRERSRSMAGPPPGMGGPGMGPGRARETLPDGTPILHFSRAVYSYTAAIPEELSFTKGEMLAVLRLQDDGWWEAACPGGPRRGARGLVPSNYLQAGG